MNPEPQAEHKWLQQLVGEWTYEHECATEPGGPPAKFTGTDSVRTLGGLWAVCEGRSTMPDGGPALTIMTLGYDPTKKRFVGTFIGSMMTYLWVYDGALDPTGKKLVLDAEGPSFTDPAKMCKYQDTIEFKSPDHRTLSSQYLGDDGQWNQFMEAHYRRA